MQTLPQMICDRCGCSSYWITLKGNNGMAAWECDLCEDCYHDVKAMMLNKSNRYKKKTD